MNIFYIAIDGEKLVPNPDNTDLECLDQMLWGWITSTLSEDTLGIIVGIDTNCKCLGSSLKYIYSILSGKDQFQQTRKLHLPEKIQRI